MTSYNFEKMNKKFTFLPKKVNDNIEKHPPIYIWLGYAIYKLQNYVYVEIPILEMFSNKYLLLMIMFIGSMVLSVIAIHSIVYSVIALPFLIFYCLWTKEIYKTKFKSNKKGKIVLVIAIIFELLSVIVAIL